MPNETTSNADPDHWYDRAVATFETAVETAAEVQNANLACWANLWGTWNAPQQWVEQSQRFIGEMKPAGPPRIAGISQLIVQSLQLHLELAGKCFELGRSASLEEMQLRASDCWATSLSAMRAATHAAVASQAMAMTWPEFSDTTVSNGHVRGLHRSQVRRGDVLDGRPRVIVVGLNCRDNCSSAAISLAAALDFNVTDLTRIAERSAVGRFVKLPLEQPTGPVIELIGLILRRDPLVPVRLDDLRQGLGHLMRYLGSHNDLAPDDVAMVAIGCGSARIDGGFAMLLKLLDDAGYPGLVYQPMSADKQLNDQGLARLGLPGGAADDLPPWSFPPSRWSDEDERQVAALHPYPEPTDDVPIGGRMTYLSGDDADQS